ncbi:MAG: endonuclease/exonuclease/phosphatase family protein [Opitutae bacterium]|nr:endonuclease/exonuclease/phosphatase family protein [Opitutae bacterium]
MSRFRVVQFNMQFGQRWDDADPDGAPVDLDGTIAEIRRHEGDIVLLQEVEQAQPGGVQPETPPNYARLRRELPAYDGFFAFPKPDPRELPFGIGLAVLSRTPLTAPTRRDLPSPPIPFDFFGVEKTPTDRLLIGVQTQVAGRALQLFNTHPLAFFMLKSSSQDHGVQRAIIAEMLRQSKLPTVIGGDFNVSRHESLVAQFSQIGYATVQQSAVTWRRRPYVLDHLFYNEHLRCVAYQVHPTPASDHHVLVADFEFR